MNRKPYPSDVSDDEWAFAAPYLMKEDAPQREHSLRELFNGVRWLVRTGAQWRMMPNDLPPWTAAYQQTQRWIKQSGAVTRMVVTANSWPQRTKRLRQPMCSAAPLPIHPKQEVGPGLDPRIWPAHAQRCLMRLLLIIDQARGIRRKLAGRAVAGKRRALKEVAA
jgi:transposase